MIIVSGRTFAHKDKIRSYGGRWNGDHQRWEFERLSDSARADLIAQVGLMISEVASPSPPPKPIADDEDDDNWLINLFVGNRTARRNINQPTKLYGDDPTYFNYFADQNPSAFFGFSSLEKFTAYIADIPEPMRHEIAWSSNVNVTESSDTKTMSEALHLARNGWQEGLDRAQETMRRLSLANPRVRRRKPSLAGGSVNVGRMLAGDPAHMISRPKQPGRKVVTFFVEAGTPGRITAKTMAIRAASIGAMVDLMEMAGYSCSVVAVDTSLQFTTPKYQLAVILKDSGERLNLSDIIFALGHPSFARRFSFAALRSSTECREIWASQGNASNSFDDEHKCSNSEFYIPVIKQNIDDPFDMIDHIIPDGLPIEIERE